MCGIELPKLLKISASPVMPARAKSAHVFDLQTQIFSFCPNQLGKWGGNQAGFRGRSQVFDKDGRIEPAKRPPETVLVAKGISPEVDNQSFSVIVLEQHLSQPLAEHCLIEAEIRADGHAKIKAHFCSIG